MTCLSVCKNPSAAAAASIIVSNVDLLTLILLRLPVKSLLVFKSVLKQWFSLISDSFFNNQYILQNSPLPIQGLFSQDSYAGELYYIPFDESSSSSAPFRTLDFIDDPYGLRIRQSCNGLMLCRGSTCTAHDKECATYYICNPSTRQHRQIVCERERHENGFKELSCVSLAYDPLKSPYYKVVCIWLVSKLGNFNYQIGIYSSETTSWKLSGEGFSTHGRRLYFYNPVFWNGSLHWIEEAGSFCFDVDRELRMEIPSYCHKVNETKILHFAECKGRLYLIVKRPSIEILEMKTDYTGWNRIYLVDLKKLLKAYGGFDYNVLFVSKEGESPNLILRLGVLGIDKVISYDLQDGSFKEIKQLAPGDRLNVAYPYIQTLACV